jgi:aminopeptidase N
MPTKHPSFVWRSLVRLLSFVVVIAAARPVVASDPRAAIDVRHYRLDLRFPPDLDSLYGRATIAVDLPTKATDSLRFDFAGLMVDSVLVGKQGVFFRRTPQKLVVALPSEFSGRSAEVTVVYRGVPEDGLIISRNKHGRRTVFADNWPNRAHFWFPGVDHPSDKATVEFRVKAPVKYEVVANGRLVEVTNNLDGTRTTVWEESVPIPMYCMVVGVAEFSVRTLGQVDGVPLSFWVFPQEREAAIQDFQRAVQMTEFFTRLIGPFPYEKLALVQSRTRFGGMENSSAIFLSENSIRGTRQVEGTVSHEIAHQWFGDSVTERDWSELWLSEGFATYFGALFFEKADGVAAFRQRMQRMKPRIFEYHQRTGRPVIDTTLTDLMQLLNPNNYGKGAWVLHMLRGLLGDEQFFLGIRTYYERYRDGNATTQEFRLVMEEVSGRPLSWFFDQWLRRPGYPVLDIAWTWNAKRSEVTIEVRQKQPEQVFRVPLDVEVAFGKEKMQRRLQIDERVTVVTLSVPRKPDSLKVDPEGWLLMQVSVKGVE